MEPGCLHSPSHSVPPCNLRTSSGAQVKLQQLELRHTLQLLPVRSGDIKARQWKLGSHHYWKKTTTDIPLTSPNTNHPHPSRLIQKGVAQHHIQLLGKHQKFRGSSEAWTLIALCILPQSPGTKVIWSQRRYTPPQGIKGIFSHKAEFQVASAVQEAYVSPTEKQPAKERSLLITKFLKKEKKEEYTTINFQVEK